MSPKKPRPTVEELKSRLSRLSAQERAELARFLIESLDVDAGPDAQAAWEAELDRRMVEIRSGTEVGIPAEEVFSQARDRLAQKMEESWLDHEIMDWCASEGDDTITLEDVRAALATIPGSLTSDFIAERDDA